VNANRRSTVLAAIATVAVATAVIAAVVILGAPSVQRQRKMDAVRVQDLTNIATSVYGYFNRHGALPADLGAVAREPGYRVALNDPEAGKPYGYQVIDATSYRLCADFATDSATDPPDSYNVYTDVTWAHGRGHQCFGRHADKISE
jgi:hypothetical protein